LTLPRLVLPTLRVAYHTKNIWFLQDLSSLEPNTIRHLLSVLTDFIPFVRRQTKDKTMGALRPLFRGLTGVALAGAMALPAIANDDANDAPVIEASVSVEAPAKMTKPQYVGAAHETPNDARILAAAASRDKVAIVVWGGTKELQLEAYKAAQQLVNEGIPVAFVLAPDSNGFTADAFFQTYAMSKPYGEATYGVDNAHLVRADIYQGARDAYTSNFPQRYSQLNLR